MSYTGLTSNETDSDHEQVGKDLKETVMAF
jgi:hypothetical protein